MGWPVTCTSAIWRPSISECIRSGLVHHPQAANERRMPGSTSPAKYVLIFDGGSRGNPGPSYGSFSLHRAGGARSRPQRRSFGPGTNNEAEYRALIAGLQSLLAILEAEALPPTRVALEVRGDSQLVLSQLEGVWKTKEPRLRELRQEAENLLDRFASVHYRHQPRARSVAVLGH